MATILGTLLLGPLAIRLLRVAGRLSVAPRLALRDLVRYQGRSGAALAAVTLALGIAATAVVVASAERRRERNAQPPNLSNRQIRVHLGPNENRRPHRLQRSRRMDRLSAAGRTPVAAQLDDATVLPLHKASSASGRSTSSDEHAGVRTLDLLQKDGPHRRPPSGSSSPRRPCSSASASIPPRSIPHGLPRRPEPRRRPSS